MKLPLFLIVLLLAAVGGAGYWAWEQDRKAMDVTGPTGQRVTVTVAEPEAPAERLALNEPDPAAADETPAETAPETADAAAPSAPPEEPEVAVTETPTAMPEPSAVVSDPPAEAAEEPLEELAVVAETPPEPAPEDPPAPVSPEPVAEPAPPVLPLPVESLAALEEKGPYGPLPRIAADGRMAREVYARPAAGDGRPRIAVIVSNLGLDANLTKNAIDTLPADVTLAFSPYGADIDAWMQRARRNGHEVLIGLPMEPTSYPNVDPGPYGLLMQLPAEENLNRLAWVLSRGSGYAGVITMMGSRFTTSHKALRPVLTEIRNRGLMFVDGRTTDKSVAGMMASLLGLPQVVNESYIDRDGNAVAIDSRLEELESMARQDGAAVAVGQPFADTVDRIAAWAGGLDAKGLALVPVSSLGEAKLKVN